MAGTSPGSSGYDVGPYLGQDTFPLQGTSHPHSLRLGQFRHTSSPHMSIFEMREESGVPEKTHEDMGKMCTLHTDSGPRGNGYFFLITVVMEDVEQNDTI